MERRPAVLLRAAEIDAKEQPYVQRLNPRSRLSGTPLGYFGKLRHGGLSRARIPKGGESFGYHAHVHDDEWIYILSGRGVARIDGAEVELGPGDFVSFPAPQVPHNLANPFDEELVYLMGGDASQGGVVDFPDLNRRYALVWDGERTAFHELGPAQYPFEVLGPKPAPWRVFTARGWGSALAEAVLAIAGIACERDEVDPSEPGAGRDRLRAANPLGQLPTIVLPDGAVLTESAAIVLYVADLAPQAKLAPAPGDPERPAFLRWLAFLVAAVYPTFTFGDEPSRWVKTTSDELRRSTDDHRKVLWHQIEAAVTGPWFLGERFSALDVYVAVMTRWRPGRAWFAEHCSRLSSIAKALDQRPDLAGVWSSNFDG
jgi:GST-like protein